MDWLVWLFLVFAFAVIYYDPLAEKIPDRPDNEDSDDA